MHNVRYRVVCPVLFSFVSLAHRNSCLLTFRVFTFFCVFLHHIWCSKIYRTFEHLRGPPEQQQNSLTQQKNKSRRKDKRRKYHHDQNKTFVTPKSQSVIFVLCEFFLPNNNCVRLLDAVYVFRVGELCVLTKTKKKIFPVCFELFSL